MAHQFLVNVIPSATLLFPVLLYMLPPPNCISKGKIMEVPDKFKGMMEIESDEVDDESEEFSEAFACCICRDLLYKPVVLACGHISCFWFLEEEKDIGCFSPQINGLDHKLQTQETIIKPFDASQSCFSARVLETTTSVQSDPVCTEAGLKISLDQRKDAAATSVTTAADRDSNQIRSNGTCKQVSVEDVLCGSCKGMLFRPIVLNCGHAYCICCIDGKTNEMFECEICQSLHPGDIPKVCLEFDHFLEEQFPKEYELRRSTFQMKQEQLSSETTPSTCFSGSSEASKESFHFSFSSGDEPLPGPYNVSSKVHIGVGCDSCGMYPIIGDRYRCKDCLEQIGYDLCQDCYTSSSKLAGRFNQQHTSNHQFEIVRLGSMHNIMMRLRDFQLQISAVSDALNNNSGNVIASSENTNEDGENAVDAPLPSSETEPNQRENEPSA
ncbi:hypothetical protein CASFOL_008609 [Castilleja foliolosa]|uniref:E3 ubiquitin-protein ligase PRT1 n=1 Tax=Castilleja foliolosa TaxID=1961234 RepID=A0ABD3E0L9_9LAMI